LIEIVEDIETLKTALDALDCDSTKQVHSAKIILNKMLNHKIAQIDQFEKHLDQQFDSA
jgi:hypothetical protein